MTTVELNGMVRMLGWDDDGDRLELADALEEAGRDEEAILLRDLSTRVAVERAYRITSPEGAVLDERQPRPLAWAESRFGLVFGKDMVTVDSGEGWLIGRGTPGKFMLDDGVIETPLCTAEHVGEFVVVPYEPRHDG